MPGYILKNLPDAKIAVLYENDYFGKDYLIGLREGLGARADQMIIASQSYERTDPTVDFAGRRTTQQRRYRFADCRERQNGCSDNSKDLRYRLAADTLPHHCSNFNQGGDAAGRTRQGGRHYFGRLRQRSQRSAVAGHARIQGMAGLDEEL